jgi:hypothetical protein
MLIKCDQDPPVDRIKQYIEKERDSGFIANAKPRPDMRLYYTINKADVTEEFEDIDGKKTKLDCYEFEIKVRNLRAVAPKISSLQLRFYAGSGPNRAFSNPTCYKEHPDSNGKTVAARVINPFLLTCSDDRFIWSGSDSAGSDGALVKVLKPQTLTNTSEQFKNEISLTLKGVKNLSYKGVDHDIAALELFEILEGAPSDGTSQMDHRIRMQIRLTGSQSLMRGSII